MPINLPNAQNDYTWWSNLVLAQRDLGVGAVAYYWLSTSPFPNLLRRNNANKRLLTKHHGAIIHQRLQRCSNNNTCTNSSTDSIADSSSNSYSYSDTSTHSHTNTCTNCDSSTNPKSNPFTDPNSNT